MRKENTMREQGYDAMTFEARNLPKVIVLSGIPAGVYANSAVKEALIQAVRQIEAGESVLKDELPVAFEPVLTPHPNPA